MSDNTVIGPDWAWEAAFVTLELSSDLSVEGERAVALAAANWFRRAATTGYQGRYAHNAYDPTFHEVDGRTAVRIVVDFGSSLQDGLDDLLETVRDALRQHGADIERVLLNVEDPSLFTLEADSREPDPEE